MKSVELHAKVLALVLALFGLSTLAWQVFYQKIPVSEDSNEPVWVVDARVQFEARPNVPVKMRLRLPRVDGDFAVLDESFVSNNYGVNIDRADGGRSAVWSTRRAEGEQTLYYRLVIPRQSLRKQPPEGTGPQFREREPLTGPEKLAAESLLEPIRKHSADVETFILEAIKRVNDNSNDNVRLLLGRDRSIHNRARVTATVLSHAHIPVEPVYTLPLRAGTADRLVLWLRSFDGKDWVYINPETGETGLPDDHLVWWAGDGELLALSGGRRPTISFALSSNKMSAIQLIQSEAMDRAGRGMGLSLYELPLQTQNNFRIILMIPYGVLLILLIRNVIGLKTLGTFTPVLIGLAFRETGVLWGALFFSVITALGLALRAYLELLHLQLLARLSVVLSFVVLLMAILSLLGYKLGMAGGLSIALFPMVILTMVIERLSVQWEERGAGNAMQAAFGTLLAGMLSHLLMSYPPLEYFTFTFPGILLVLTALMLAMGHYRGYRLTELRRFKAMLSESP